MKTVRFKFVDVIRLCRNVWIKGDNADVYYTYRLMSGCTIQESWRVMKPFIKLWSGKSEGEKQDG